MVFKPKWTLTSPSTYKSWARANKNRDLVPQGSEGSSVIKIFAWSLFKLWIHHPQTKGLLWETTSSRGWILWEGHQARWYSRIVWWTELRWKEGPMEWIRSRKLQGSDPRTPTVWNQEARGKREGSWWEIGWRGIQVQNRSYLRTT